MRELPLPFIVHQERQGGWFRLVTRIEGDQLTFWDSSEGIRQQSLASFEQAWSEVVLIAENNVDSGEVDYVSKRRKEQLENLRKPAIYAIGGITLALALSMLLPGLTLVRVGWLLTKTLGLALSMALLAKQFGSRNSLVDRLCHIGDKSSCQSLLDSPAAKLWGWLSWAEIGTLYFSGCLCIALLGPNPLLGWLALMALPHTLFSVYCQAQVARIWCPLCIGVQVVFLAEGVLSFAGPLLPITLSHTLLVFIFFALAAMGWLLLKPVLAAAQAQRRDNQNLIAFGRPFGPSGPCTCSAGMPQSSCM